MDQPGHCRKRGALAILFALAWTISVLLSPIQSNRVAWVTRGEEASLLWGNESTVIPHEMLEIQADVYLGEDDTARFKDNYGHRRS